MDDKYQYTCEVKENNVHGWISTKSRVGFWLISPSGEYRCGGPTKQDLTSHVGPTTLTVRDVPKLISQKFSLKKINVYIL